jgi:hypothetical protein
MRPQVSFQSDVTQLERMVVLFLYVYHHEKLDWILPC